MAVQKTEKRTKYLEDRGIRCSETGLQFSRAKAAIPLSLF